MVDKEERFGILPFDDDFEISGGFNELACREESILEKFLVLTRSEASSHNNQN